jgi:hypothetical protein
MNSKEIARWVELQNEKAEQAAKWGRLKAELWRRVEAAMAKEKSRMPIGMLEVRKTDAR